MAQTATPPWRCPCGCIHLVLQRILHVGSALSHLPSPAAAATMLYLEDMEVGDKWWSKPREISGDDVAEFAVLTGDEDPLHCDDGEGSPFGEPVAHGLLGLSIMAGLSSDCPRVATLALVEIADWKFEAPIFFGDTVRVLTTAESISPHGRRAGRVVWRRQLLNQHDRVVQSGRIVSLVARRNRAPRPSSVGASPTMKSAAIVAAAAENDIVASDTMRVPR